MKLLQSIWFVALLGTLLFVGTTFALIKPALMAARLAFNQKQEQVKLSVAPNNSWDYKSPEVDLLITELKKEKATMALRDQQLNELALRLQAEKAELNQVTQQVHRLQREFDQSVVRVREEENVNLKKLAKVYTSMSPEGASAILKEMTNDQIARILVFMKETEAAPILESLGKENPEIAKRAADISERLRLFIPEVKSVKTKKS